MPRGRKATKPKVEKIKKVRILKHPPKYCPNCIVQDKGWNCINRNDGYPYPEPCLKDDKKNTGKIIGCKYAKAKTS